MGAALDTRTWDIVLSDYSMPRFSAPAALELVRERNLDLPRSFGRRVTVIKYSSDTETYLRALNINCAVYPFDMTREAGQVRRVKQALQALVRATPRKR